MPNLAHLLPYNIFLFILPFYIMEQSPKYQLNATDGKKLLIGAGVALGGALLTYLAETIPGVDFGAFTPMAVALSGILVNAARKWLAGISL